MVIVPGKCSKKLGLNEAQLSKCRDKCITKDDTQCYNVGVLLFMCVCLEGSELLTAHKTSHNLPLTSEALPLFYIVLRPGSQVQFGYTLLRKQIFTRTSHTLTMQKHQIQNKKDFPSK